jgi:hypothetical protein
MKYFLLMAFIVTALNAEYMPKRITSQDLKDLNAIDERLYTLALKKEEYNFSSVSLFIYNNLAYDLDFTRFKVVGSASLRTTRNLKNESNVYTDESDRARAQLMITYPFFDAKENNERLAKMVTTKQKIINDVKAYFKLKAKCKDLEIEKLILLRVETRAKARKLQAVGSFDEWLKVIENIRKINADLTQTEIDKSDAEQTLLSYVLSSKRQALKEML